MPDSTPHPAETFLELARENFIPRLFPSGGRPTDPSWDIKRIVNLSSDTFEALQSAAETLSTDKRKISLMQVAAFAIETALFMPEFGMPQE